MPRTVAVVALVLLAAGARLAPAQTPTQPPPPPEQQPPLPTAPLPDIEQAPPIGKEKLSGQLFFDYFYNLRGTAAVIQDSSGFQLRRVYLTYDRPLSQDLSFRFRLEANGTERTGRQTGPGIALSKISVFVKQASVEWRNAFLTSTLQMGLAPTPLLDNEEKAWAYRSVEKVGFDLRGFGSTTDLGVGLKGPIFGRKELHYHAMYGNGSFQSPDADRSHRGYLGLWVDKSPYLVEAVGDVEGGPERADRYSLKGLAALLKDTWTIGASGFLRWQKAALATDPDVKPVGASVFGRGHLTDHWGALGRADYFDPDANSDIGWREVLLIGGYDYQPIDPVHLIPNAEVTLFDGKGATPARKSDVVLRVTLFLLFD